MQLLLKLVLAIILLLLIGIGTVLFSPLKQQALNELQMEANGQLNKLITSANSPLLSPLDAIEGRRPKVSYDPAAILNNEALNQWIFKSQTEVLIIQHRREIIYEYYSAKSNMGQAINSMSMAKNVIALLIGIAIDEGLIASTETDIRQYLPELVIPGNRSISIRDLLNHLTGIQTGFDELDKTLQGQPLTEQLSAISFDGDKQFRYNNINYHLLSIILRRAYQQPLNQIIHAKLWQPLNLEQAAVINSTGYCCLFATGRSWLALGELYLNKGSHNGLQVVPKKWIETMITDSQYPNNFFVQTTGASKGNSYGYHIYGGLKNYPDSYWIEGMGLQVIFIDPSDETIILRLGGIPSFVRLTSNRRDEFLMEDLMSLLEEMKR